MKPFWPLVLVASVLLSSCGWIPVGRSREPSSGNLNENGAPGANKLSINGPEQARVNACEAFTLTFLDSTGAATNFVDANGLPLQINLSASGAARVYRGDDCGGAEVSLVE